MKLSATTHLVTLSLLFACAAIPTTGQNKVDFPKDGNGLLDSCSGLIDAADSPGTNLSLAPSAFADKMQKISWCIGYLQATQDVFITREVNLAIVAATGVTFQGPDKAKAFAVETLRVACVPEKATVLQLTRVLVKWLRDHPERLHETRSILVSDAFKEAFPCTAVTK